MEAMLVITSIIEAAPESGIEVYALTARACKHILMNHA